jgi:hypothetical protein
MRVLSRPNNNASESYRKMAEVQAEIVEKMTLKLAEYQKNYREAKETLDRLDGTKLEDQVKAQKEQLEARNKFNAMTKQQLSAAIKDEKNYSEEMRKIAQEVYHYRFGSGEDETNKDAEKLAKKQAKERKKLLLDAKTAIEIETAAYNQRLKEAGIYGVKLEKMTDEQRKKQLELETEYQNNLQKIALEYEDKKFEKAKKDTGVDGNSKNFTKEQNAVLELLQKQHEANIQKIKDDSGKKLKDIQKNIDDAALKSVKESNAAAIVAITAKQKVETLSATEEEKTVAKLEKRKQQIEVNSFAARIVQQESYVAALKRLNPTEQQTKEFADAEAQLAQMQAQANEQKLVKEKELQDKIKQLREQYGLVNMSEGFANEMKILKEQYEQKLLSEEEFQQAKLQIQLKYAQEYAQQAESLVNGLADAVSAIEESQTAKVGTEYTKRQSALTEMYNQGKISQDDYNKEKEKLDYEQRKKELDIQKKYADVNFALQVSQIIASTALAAMQAYSAMAGIPYVGPVLGGIAAGAATVAGSFQIATAKAERDRVKAMTLEAPGGSDSAQKSGQIVLRNGFAEGGANFESGGYTGKGGKYEVAGYVPVHHGEYVIASDELRQPEIMNMARSIEKERRKRTSKNAVRGFAEGGYNSSDEMPSIEIDNATGNRIASVLERLENGNITIQTNYGITELEAEQKRKIQAESNFKK